MKKMQLILTVVLIALAVGAWFVFSDSGGAVNRSAPRSFGGSSDDPLYQNIR